MEDDVINFLYRFKLKPTTYSPGGRLNFAYDGFSGPQISEILEISLEKVLEALQERDKILAENEKYYFENEWPKVEKNIREFIEEFPKAERDEMRRRYLLEQLREAKKDYPRTKERMKRLQFEIRIFTGEIQGISPEMIGRARNYSLDRLIESKRGMARCPFHSDKTPSMDVRKNFYYCYGCQATGDSIDLLMKTEGLNFRQAVQKLSM